MKFSHTSRWTSSDRADGTPRTDVFGLEIGRMFYISGSSTALIGAMPLVGGIPPIAAADRAARLTGPAATPDRLLADAAGHPPGGRGGP